MSSKTEAREWWIPTGLALLALAVRLPGLDGGLWADEIYSTLYAFRTPFPQSLFEFHGDNKHPFYALLAHASRWAFGESAWSLRLPALAFGVASVPMLYVLGRRITGRGETAVAAALLAVSYHHTWFSQNARGYAVLGFCAIASTWLLLRFMEKGHVRDAVAFAVCIAVGAYTHLTFVFAVLAQFIVAVAATVGWPRGSARLGWRAVLGMFVGGGALAVLFYAPMLQRVIDFFLHKESNLKGISSPGWAVSEGVRVLMAGFGGGLRAGAAIVVLGLAAVVGLAGLVSYLRQDKRVGLLLALPALTMLAGALAIRGTMYPRFFFLLAGFVILIGVRGIASSSAWIAQLIGKAALGKPIGYGVLALAALASAASLPRNWRLPKQDYEGALRYVEGNTEAGDAVATADMTTEIYGRFFERRWHDVRDVAGLEALRRDRKVWLVYTFPQYLARYDARLADMVEKECRPERVFPGSVGGGEVVVCTLSPTGP